MNRKNLKTGKERKRLHLIKSLKPDATNETPPTSQTISPTSVSRKLPLRSVYQTEPFDDFLLRDKINSFNDFVDSLSPFVYSFSKYDKHIVIILYQLEVNGLSFHGVIGCIRVDGDLHVNPFMSGDNPIKGTRQFTFFSSNNVYWFCIFFFVTFYMFSRDKHASFIVLIFNQVYVPLMVYRFLSWNSAALLSLRMLSFGLCNF